MATVRERKNKDGTISYLIRAFCGYDANGRQVERSITWKPAAGMSNRATEKELQRQIVAFEQKCDGGESGGDEKFETFARSWFKEYAEPNLRIRTVARHHQLEARTYAAIGHIRLDRLNARHIQSFINSLSEPGANQITGGKLSPKTLRVYLSFISTVLGYAVRMGAIRDNPCPRVSLPPLDRKEKPCYTIEETQAFLTSLQTAPLCWHAFFVLAIYGGFRRGELLGLEWKDIDFDGQVISIRRTSQYVKGGVFTDTTKTEGSQRSLKLPSSVFDVLRRHRAQQTVARLKLGDQWQDYDRLFTAWDGKPIHPNSPYHWLLRFCEQTGQRFLGIHAFRHLNASLLINSGADVRTVSASLGHSTPATTLNIYAHSFQEAQARAGEAIATALEARRA